MDDLRLKELLAAYMPRLVGTVPIGIDVAASDLDVICEVSDLRTWCAYVRETFGHLQDFRCSADGSDSATANFRCEGWEIELFGQNRPTGEQNGYRHMVVEERLLRLLPQASRERIISWKAAGIRTEPAFARLLALAGDPYQALLELGIRTDEELARLISEAGIPRQDPRRV